MKREGNKPPEIVSLRELQNSWSKLVVARQHGRLPRTLVDLEEAVNVTVFSLGMRTESLVALALEHQATPFKRQQALKHRREIRGNSRSVTEPLCIWPTAAGVKTTPDGVVFFALQLISNPTRVQNIRVQRELCSDFACQHSHFLSKPGHLDFDVFFVTLNRHREFSV